MVHVREPSAGLLSRGTWYPHCEARGTVTIPPDHDALLHVKYLGTGPIRVQPHDLTWVDHLAPNDLQGLLLQGSLSNIPKLAHLNGLHQLGLTRVPLESAELAFLPTLTQLRWLDLTSSRVDDQGLSLVGAVPRLEELGLQRVRAITDAGLQHVGNLHHLRVLLLSSTNLSSSGLSTLRRFPHLEELYLAGTNVDDTALDSLPDAAPLRVLSLSGSRIRGASLRRIGQFPTLEELHLRRLMLNDGTLAYFGNLTSLRLLDLSDTPLDDRDALALQTLTSLQTLKLSGTTINPNTVATLHAALPNCIMWSDYPSISGPIEPLIRPSY